MAVPGGRARPAGRVPTVEDAVSNEPADASAPADRPRPRPAAVCDALGQHRLVTVTGSGGTGKTRLAVQVGIELRAAYPNGVFFAGLAAVASADMVGPFIAGILGVRESPGEDLETAITDHLEGRRALILLDNYEHVLDASGIVTSILERAADVRIIGTSRSPLRIAAEYEYPLAPLEAQDAVALFQDRTSGTAGALDTVAELCRLLDGLPLAIELAAARSNLMTPEAMLERIPRRYRYSTRAAGPTSAPADATRHDRVELRAVESVRATAVPPPVSVRRRYPPGRGHARLRFGFRTAGVAR